MSQEEHHKTPDEAAAMACAFALDKKCVAANCMAWRWAWAERDGYEERTEEQAHWSELVRLEPTALEPLLMAKGVPAPNASDLTKRFVVIATAQPPHPEDFQGREVEFDEDDDEDDVGRAALLMGVPAEFLQARREWNMRLSSFVDEVNRVIEAVTTPEAIAEYARTHAPDDTWTPQESGISNAIIFAKYVRQVRRRGFCGRVEGYSE